MRIFKEDEKVNFVDENNVLVGYDLSQSCCEIAGWFISDRIITENITEQETVEDDLSSYKFDTGYFNKLDFDSDEIDDGGLVVFRLHSNGKKDLFLHIFNIHNGYYGHGFEAKIGGLKWETGCL